MLHTPFSSELALDQSLQRVIGRFEREDADVRHWKRYPNVSERVDESMAVCDEMSRRFKSTLVTAGIEDARIVEASAAPTPLTDYHQWVRVGTGPRCVNVDWTARQFHNLEHPPNPKHLRIPVPLVWLGEGPGHPVVPYTEQRLID